MNTARTAGRPTTRCCRNSRSTGPPGGRDPNSGDRPADATHRTARPRTESGTPPEAADEYSPDGWEANHAVLSQLAEHRIAWRP